MVKLTLTLMFRVLLTFAIAALLVFPLILLGYVLTPIGLRYGFHGVLWPWGNDDHPDNGGKFWKKRCGDNNWCAYQWFANRNPAFNFGKYVMGFVSSGNAVRVAGVTGKIGDLKAEGWYYARDGWAWEIYWIRRWQRWPDKCIRFRCGWKIDGKQAGERCAFCFAPNPIMPYSGS